MSLNTYLSKLVLMSMLNQKMVGLHSTFPPGELIFLHISNQLEHRMTKIDVTLILYGGALYLL